MKQTKELPAWTQDWKVEGEFCTGCHTSEGNNIALYMDSTFGLGLFKNQTFAALAVKYGHNTNPVSAASVDEVAGMIAGCEIATEIPERVVARYHREMNDEPGLRGVAQYDFTNYLARSYVFFIREETRDMTERNIEKILSKPLAADTQPIQVQSGKATHDPSDLRATFGECRIEGQSLYLPASQLPNYAALKRQIETMGGKWNTSQQCFAFTGEDPSIRIADYVGTGKASSHKKEKQAFFTPTGLAKAVASLANLGPGMLVLEPSGGHGAIADAAVAACPKIELVCVETHQPYADVLVKKGHNTLVMDFMAFTDGGRKFDRVVMNPPFNKGQHKTHVVKAAGHLVSGGILVAVVPAGKGLEDAKAAGLYDVQIVEVGDGAFKESGTMVKTEIVVGVKA